LTLTLASLAPSLALRVLALRGLVPVLTLALSVVAALALAFALLCLAILCGGGGTCDSLLECRRVRA